MDWNRAIDVNQVALARVVAEIYALLGIVSGLAIERMLRPAESALRRLIVIAAQGLVVKSRAVLSMPKGLVITRKSDGRKSFQLFDPRKNFTFIIPENTAVVMVKTHTQNPFNPFDQMYWSKPKIAANTDHISRRLSAFKHALETIPQQAIRLVRWQAKREAMKNPKFTNPLRPGRPPGYRPQPKRDVDYILKECHGLAWDVQFRNST